MSHTQKRYSYEVPPLNRFASTSSLVWCTRPIFYHTSVLTYADAVWGSCIWGGSNWLEYLQNYATRIILGRCRDVTATVMCCELQWPTLVSRRALVESQVVYQLVLQAVVHNIWSLSLCKWCKSTDTMHVWQQQEAPVAWFQFEK